MGSLSVCSLALAVAAGSTIPEARRGQDTPVPPRATIAIVGVDVIPMNGAGNGAGAAAGKSGVLADRTVVVEAGRITAVGAADGVEVPEGALRIDGSGRLLMPGLAEMHGHLPGSSQSDAFAEAVLFLYLANGVTTVRGMLGDPRQLDLRARIAAGELAGPRLFVGSPPLHGGSVQTAPQGRELVRSFTEAGYDHIKVHEGLPPMVYDAIAEEARAVGLRFGGHVSDKVGLERALEQKQATIDHLDNIVASLVPAAVRARYPDGLPPAVIAAQADEARIDTVVAQVRASGAAVVPTMALWETFMGGVSSEELERDREGLEYLPRALVRSWVGQLGPMGEQFGGAPGARILELRARCLAALADAGVPVLLGTDSPQLFSVPGFSIRLEMEAMAAAGLEPAVILRSGTSAVADYYGESDRAGAVAPGHRADLVLLRENPLEDVAHVATVEGVIHDGRWLSRQAIDERLAVIAETIGQ